MLEKVGKFIFELEKDAFEVVNYLLRLEQELLLSSGTQYHLN